MAPGKQTFTWSAEKLYIDGEYTTLLLVRSELAGLDPRPRILKRMIKEQWLMDIDFLPDAYVAGFRDEFVEMAMCDYLGNLARMDR